MIRILTMLAAAVLAGCSNGNAVQTESERVLSVRVASATSGPAAPTIRASGVLRYKDETRLAFKIGGVIAKILVDEGQPVSKGQVLAELELAEIGSQVEQTQQMLAKAQRDLERGERLFQEQVIPLEALQDLRTQREMAAQSLKATRFNKSTAIISAPGNGVVLRKLAENSETVAPGAPVLIVGSAEAGFVMNVSLSDRDVVQVAFGDVARLRFDALPGEDVEAKVTRLPAAADPKSGLFDVELAVASHHKSLRSGLVGRVSLVPASASAGRLVRIPIASVIEGDRDRASVFVVEGEVVKRTPIEIAFIDGDLIALNSGVDEGTRVVTDGAAYVEDGKRVRILK